MGTETWNRLLMVLPALLAFLLFFGGTLWIDGLGPEGRWQFRYVHLPYHLPQMLMLVFGSFVGSITGQAIKKVAKRVGA